MTDNIDKVLGALPGTVSSIESKTGLGRTTVLRHLLNLRKAKWVYISGYKKVKKKRSKPIYKIGNLPDVVYVKPTPAEYWKSWCQNNPEGLALKRARERVRQRLLYRSRKAQFATGIFGALFSNVDLRTIANRRKTIQ